MKISKNSLIARAALTGLLVTSLTGCSSGAADLLNPFEDNGPETELGERSLAPALGSSSGADGTTSEADRARQALEVMGSYQRTQAPQPYNPVMNPAQVRLMWIPDHINKNGDLVPAHFYYLRVLPQTWAVQDAFEIERQLNVQGQKGEGGAQPWVYSETKK
ncbi:MAG: hypothetical protein IT290_01700 [Deltaproteobacteria bacterium]|nr:hypothetical protein [Deltaproteobacteria bacterium]